MQVSDISFRLQRILRSGEQPLIVEAAVALPYDDPDMRLVSGSRSAPLGVAVTPARLIEIGQSGRVSSGRWGDMAELSVHKTGRKWRYQWRHMTQQVPYQPIQISSKLAAVLNDIQSGRMPLMTLPEELTTYSAVDRSHDGSPLGAIARKMDVFEVALICDACGDTVGFGEPYGAQCLVCHRNLGSAKA